MLRITSTSLTTSFVAAHVVILCLMLGGCLNTPNDNTVPESNAVTVSGQSASSTSASGHTDEAAPATSNELSAEAILAATLRGATNQYMATKRIFDQDTKQHFENALRHYNAQDFDQALDLAQLLSKANNAPSAVWVLLGDIARAKNDINLAATHYTQAIAINSVNYFALNRLGTIAREQGDFQQAKQCYLDALSAWPGYANGHYNLGILHDLYLGDKISALNHYSDYHALVSYPESQPAHHVDERAVKQIERWMADVNRQVSATATATGRPNE